jgi:hypothetical protein
MSGELQISVPTTVPGKGPVAPVEGGNLVVAVDGGGVHLKADAAGLRDLARWCLVLSDPEAQPGAHIHLDPNVTPLTESSLPLAHRVRGRDLKSAERHVGRRALMRN